MIDIIRDIHIPKEMLHWGREHLTHTPEELAAYFTACDVINSDGLWYSQNIRDSKYVIKSTEVTNCVGVFESTNIENSSDIVNSENVNDSQ